MSFIEAFNIILDHVLALRVPPCGKPFEIFFLINIYCYFWLEYKIRAIYRWWYGDQ